MLAPIGPSTGDGRRFAEGGIHLADVPFPLEWARSREGGHDGAVPVGAVQQAAILTVDEALTQGYVSADAAKYLDPTTTAVWAKGEMFDDANREEMPRMAEDVAEAMHLMGAGTLGPSVDLDSFEGSPVMAGTDVPVTWEMVEEYQVEHGEEPKLELLITEGRVRAATLVSIPAFAETSRPLELIVPEQEPIPADGGQGGSVAALIASTATAARPDVDAFTLPALDRPTPITWDWDTGRVYGHIATWQTCHVGYADVCVTAPRDASGGYAAFNRFPVDTADGGTVWAGRITVGGRHAGLDLTASSAMATYDTKTVAAHVRAYEDEFGIVVAGVIELAEDAPERAVLERRKVSGDWRETPDGLSLLEVLALSPGPRAHAEPGFPVTFSRQGRQVALTAAFGPDPNPDAGVTVRAAVDVDALAAALEQRQAERAKAAQARAGLAAAIRVTADLERASLATMVGRWTLIWAT
jgi:hypothetical protein